MDIERNYNAAVDFIDRNVAEGRGNKAAFVDASRAISYAQLHDAVARVGPALARFGLERENRIAIILYDSIEFPILFWGAIRAGIIPVLMNTLLTEDQYHYLLADSRAKMAFVSAPLLPVVQRAATDVPTLRQIVVIGDGPQSLPRLDALLAAEREPAAMRTCVAARCTTGSGAQKQMPILARECANKIMILVFGQRRVPWALIPARIAPQSKSDALVMAMRFSPL